MEYAFIAIADSEIPAAREPVFQHVVDTYASESNKVISTWKEFRDDDLGFKPHEKSSTVSNILRHELLSERRFFGQFVGTPEPAVSEILPEPPTVAAYCIRMRELALPRLFFISRQATDWWLEERPFFDTQRQRIWIFWRRVLHTAHHRTQLTVYLRLLNRTVPATYGPTADVTWTGADPTLTVQAADRL